MALGYTPGSGATVATKLVGADHFQEYIPRAEADATFRGRAQTFRIPGLAGTAGQRLFALHNATGSTKVVRINQITIDLYQTVVKAVTVAPPIIRIHRITALPTGGAACAKVSKDTALTTSASVTAFQGASADGTGAAYTAAWFLGLKGSGTPVVGDTLATHGTWAEVNPYTGNRPAITFGTSASGSNTATAVSYTVTSSATVAGAFVASVNTGTAGILYSAGDFASARAVVAGDVLNVSLTVSAT